MAGKIRRTVVIDRAKLDDWMKKRGMDYKGLAEHTGMSVTQAYNVTHRTTGGASTIGYLATLEIPDLLFLITYEINGGRKSVQDVKRLTLRLE